MLPKPLSRYRRPLVVAFHIALIPISYLAAFALRFDFEIPEGYLPVILTTLLVLAPVRVAALAGFGLFRTRWRHSGMRDLTDLAKALAVSSLVFLAALYFLEVGARVPRSVLIMDWGIALLLFGGLRFGVRAIREWMYGLNAVERRGTPTLLIGAGEGGERLLKLVRQGGMGIRPLGIVDDDPEKKGMRLHGVSVLGTTDDLPRLAEHCGAKLVVIAIPSATREQMKRVVDQCIAAGVEFKIVPSLAELMDGRARMSQLRKVEVEDLLGREPVELDLDRVRRDLQGQVVLITGGAGSIGSELARQIAAAGPRRLILLEQAESPLYFTDLEIRKAHPELDLVPVIADVTDQARLRHVFAEHRPDYVYHAAAYKHVPLMEQNVSEAVRNNVFGTLAVAELAAEFGARKFVLISTDKAVRPSSVMGATKRIAERIVLAWPSLKESGTDFRAVRFGNVLGSDGSVIPLFRKQLAQGGPLTITDPEVTRYFMTIPEAVQLVLQAATLPEASGRICMLEMGDPVRIVELAENLIRLSGLEPYKDVPIVFTGLRPGEKLFEELMTDVEETVPTAVEKVRVVETDSNDRVGLQEGLDRLATAVGLPDPGALLPLIRSMIPESVPPLRGSALELFSRDPAGQRLATEEPGSGRSKVRLVEL
jgi:FlaA1/EpsC-like NDP-sugar epimerase